MKYEITSKHDLSGAMVVVRFPEEDLDRKALYTLQKEWPSFLVPFHYRSVDGQIECTYQLGRRSKLHYRFGSRSVKEYVDFWGQILQPLLDCGDWFLKPFSFVLDVKHLYADKDSDKVSYLYIPSKQDCSSYEVLKDLAIELSQSNSVTDPNLENKVLKAIMQDFQPKEFLQMLRTVQADQIQTVREKEPPIVQKAAEELVQVAMESKEKVESVVKKVSAGIQTPSDPDDIVINFAGDKKKPEKPKEKKESKWHFGGKKNKVTEPKPVKKGGLFGKKQESPKEILLGAAMADFAVREPERNFSGYSASAAQVSVVSGIDMESEVTQLMEENGCARLVLAGNSALPHEIPVNIEAGQVFTIGRFDVSIGSKQSSFEFEKGTKAVSRRHAAIEREGDGTYVIIDLVSSAGTFVDSQRLTPNVPYPLKRGSRVSFGTAGADYIWEA